MVIEIIKKALRIKEKLIVVFLLTGEVFKDRGSHLIFYFPDRKNLVEVVKKLIAEQLPPERTLELLVPSLGLTLLKKGGKDDVEILEELWKKSN